MQVIGRPVAFSVWLTTNMPQSASSSAVHVVRCSYESMVARMIRGSGFPLINASHSQ
jgi:hypothetical protein